MDRSSRAVLAAIAIIAVSACSGTSPGPTTAPGEPGPTIAAGQTTTGSVAPSTPLPSTGPAQGASAAAWCALVIDINTRAGSMVDKTYVSPPTAAMTKQAILEGLARKDEILSVTPPEIHAAMAAELAYYQVLADWANQNGWDALLTNPSAPPPPADFIAAIGPLTSFQQTQCGIKFG
jgi:hypothetical protein